MAATAYYNEHDPKKAAWLRQLIADGLIASGVVDERSIEDVVPSELVGYTQCHFFAGIGVWSYALRCAGWPDERPAWTASCPCQSFSSAGQRKGFDDERHLFPALFWLVCELRPDVVFGEQVSSKDGLAWLDLVRSDMEGEGYAVGALDLCAASVGAPHIRQRLYWVADSDCAEHEAQRPFPFGMPQSVREGGDATSRGGVVDGMADTPSPRRDGPIEDTEGEARDEARVLVPGEVGGTFRVADADGTRQRALSGELPEGAHAGAAGNDRACDRAPTPGPTNGFWRDADWLLCRDERWRPVRPGSAALAHGAPARVVRLGGYGDAIVAPLATEFIGAYMDVRPNATATTARGAREMANAGGRS